MKIAINYRLAIIATCLFVLFTSEKCSQEHEGGGVIQEYPHEGVESNNSDESNNANSKVDRIQSSSAGTAVNNASHEMTKAEADSIIRTNISTTSYLEYVKLSNNDSVKIVTFAKDILDDRKFTQEISDNPQYVSPYYRNLSSPLFRTKIDILRYFSFGSMIFTGGDAKSIYDKHKHAFSIFCQENNGENIHIERIGTEDMLVYSPSGECLGTIEICREDNLRYLIKIECGVDETNRLLNMPALPYTKYIIDRSRQGCKTEIITMGHGLKKSVKATIGGNNWKKNEISRGESAPQSIIRGYRDLMKIIDPETGIAKSMSLDAIQDDGGHIIPRSWGGQDEAMNLFPQNWVMNQNKDYIWKKTELAGDEYLGAKKGLVTLKVSFCYKNNTMRPWCVIRTQKNGGQVLCSDSLYNIEEVSRDGNTKYSESSHAEPGFLDRVWNSITSLFECINR